MLADLQQMGAISIKSLIELSLKPNQPRPQSEVTWLSKPRILKFSHLIETPYVIKDLLSDQWTEKRWVEEDLSSDKPSLFLRPHQPGKKISH